MLGGYTGKDLWVDLSSGKMTEEDPGDDLRRDFIGGYGIAARLLFARQPAGVDPLGPENVLGITTGPLTGSPAPGGTRWTAVGRSPLTHGWGDANGSGFVGAALRQAGYDNIYFTGIAPEPVYLLAVDGQDPELRSARELWGRDTYYVDDWAKEAFGSEAEVVCIGPASEMLSLISGVVHAKGRVAARSGLGAVMGSKKLKAVVVKGDQKLRLAHPSRTAELKKKWVRDINAGVGDAEFFRTTGTPGYTPEGIEVGDSPTRNWGASVLAFPDIAPLAFDELLKYRVKRRACWRCPVGCWGTSRVEYGGRVVEGHQPEYETASAFGSMTLNNSYPSLIAVNEICNRSGLDTISAGAAVAFAIECFQEGLITEKDTGGIRLDWGDHEAIVAMTAKVARREDFGDVLADGVRSAAETLGPEAEPFAIHVCGQELPMHDPRFEPALGVIYALDATPGRHTQGNQYYLPLGYESDKPEYGEEPQKQVGRGKYIRECSLFQHVINAMGLCMVTSSSTDVSMLPEIMTAITGHTYTTETLLECGERIGNIRQAFTVREGLNLASEPLPDRAYGRPPLPDGPTAGISVDMEQMSREFLEAMDWTLDGAAPTAEKLESLGMADVSRELWG